MAAIFDLPVSPLLDSVKSSPTELLFARPLNVGVAFGIILYRSRVIYCVVLFLLPVLGGHLWFATHADIHINPVVFLDPINTGSVLGFPLVPGIEVLYHSYLLQEYGRHLYLSSDSHPLYIIEVQFGLSTVQWTASQNSYPFRRQRGRGFGSPPPWTITSQKNARVAEG